MMTSESVLAWLQTLPVRADNYYCGILDRKKEKSFGVYQLSRRKNETAVGGRDPTRTRTHGVSLLVHWNHSTRQTQNAAIALYEAIAAAGTAAVPCIFRCSRTNPLTWERTTTASANM
jgi:type IV secretory pathway VirJ component